MLYKIANYQSLIFMIINKPQISRYFPYLKKISASFMRTLKIEHNWLAGSHLFMNSLLVIANEYILKKKEEKCLENVSTRYLVYECVMV